MKKSEQRVQAIMSNVEQVDFESLVELYRGLKGCAGYLETALRAVAQVAMQVRVGDGDDVAGELDLVGELLEDFVSDVLFTVSDVPGVGRALLDRLGEIFFAAAIRLTDREQVAGRHPDAGTAHFSEEVIAKGEFPAHNGPEGPVYSGGEEVITTENEGEVIDASFDWRLSDVKS